MKRKIVSILLCMMTAAFLVQGCGGSPGEETAVSTEEQADMTADVNVTEEQTDVTTEVPAVQENTSGICLAAADAEITGQGINSAESTKVDTVYVDELNAVNYFGTDSTIIYTVPEGTEGNYDVYLNIAKSAYAFGSTPVSVIVNGEKEYVRPAAIVSCAQDFSDLFSMGTFLMIEDITLKPGDTLTVHGKPGFEMEYGGKMVSSMSAIGDMYLYPTGTEVAVGYDGGIVPEKEEADANDALSGLRIVWLGSSVTFGMQSGGYTMADAIADNHAATECLKYAVSGTTLANDSATSYVERMKEIDPDMNIDLFVVQLSTNDATQGKTLGSVSESANMEDFDDTTVVGAMEYIIAYVEETWDCPVVFYTGTYYEDENYADMVDALIQLQEKWNIGVVDLWNDEEMTALYGTEQYEAYMGDEIHPVRDGYVDWWTPKFEVYLSEYMSKAAE